MVITMVRCTRGQVIKFSYRKPDGVVSSAQYKGRIIGVIPTPFGRDVLLEMGNEVIRRFHVCGIGKARRVGIIERVIDWMCGTSYHLPIA